MSSFPRPALALLLLLAGLPSLPAETSPAIMEADDPDELENETEALPDAPAEEPALAQYWEAMKLFRSSQQEDLAKGRALLAQAADAENSHAENYLGLCLEYGLHGHKKNLRNAVTWYQLSAQRGNAFAKANLGRCYTAGIGVRKDHAKAREQLLAVVADDADFSAPKAPEDFFPPPADDTGDLTLSGQTPVDPADRSRALAHFMLGTIATKEKKTAEAQEHLVKAATAGSGGRAGILDAAMAAATNYAFGNGIPRDIDKANAMLDQSRKLTRHRVISIAHTLVESKTLDDFAQADFEESVSEKTDQIYSNLQLQIAGSFADPKSKQYNPQEAVRWLELAAEGKQPWAMLQLAFLHHEGRLGKPDLEAAFKWFKTAADRSGHQLAWSNLAICYQHGIGTEKDPAKADAIFKKHRDNSIVSYLGTLGQCPPAILTYEEELELTKTWASKHKDPHAAFLYGSRFYHGTGVKQNVETAQGWWERAGKQNHGPSLRELGRVEQAIAAYSPYKREASLRRCFNYLEKAAAVGDVEALIDLADLLSPPGGFEPKDDPLRPLLAKHTNPQRAEVLYLRALLTDKENGRAHNNIANIYARQYNDALQQRRQMDALELRDKLLKHYEAAHQAGIATAALNLGNLYYDGVLGEKDYQTAYTYFEEAAANGETSARRRLGEMHEKGEGVPVTYREAAYHYRLGAIGGDVESLIRLCNFYLQGKGVDQDLDRATHWLNLLVRHGRVGALVTMGDILIAKGEYDKAFKFYGQLRHIRIPQIQGAAYDRLARFYRDGVGVRKNPQRADRYHARAVALGNGDALALDADKAIQREEYGTAIELLRKATDAGSHAAEYQLSSLYFNGLGVEKDLPKALEHCRRAADKGNRDAAFTLAVLAYKETPGAPDLEAAIRYAEAAEARGHSKAGLVRRKLEERRTTASPATSENARSL